MALDLVVGSRFLNLQRLDIYVLEVESRDAIVKT